MKKLLFSIFLLFSFLSHAQEYVDLFKINYGNSFQNKFKNTDSPTSLSAFAAELTLPIEINANHALVSGIDYSLYDLQLFPNHLFSSLHSTTLKIGLASQWNEKWSSSLILLPKIASDYQPFSTDGFLFGIFASFKFQQSENLWYRFGFYGSQEAFGIFATPTFGWYYLSPNQHFEMNLNLPINGEISYQLGKISVGTDYFGISRSYYLHSKNQISNYVDLNSLDFSVFIQTKLINNSILFRGKIGYGTHQFKVFSSEEKLDLKLSAFSFGDHRNQLNPDLQGSLFFKVEAIYRFELRKEEE